MLFEVQQELFFQLATERLPGGPDVPRFPTGNPSRNALSGDLEQVDATHSGLRHAMTSLVGSAETHQANFHLLRESISESKLIWKPITGS